MKRIRFHIAPMIAAIALLALAGCSSSRETGLAGSDDHYPAIDVLHSEEGVASYYHRKFQGRRTASGERFDNTALTAAHRDFPFGTWVRVTAVETGKSVIVRINDRGPYKRTRLIDLSQEAARHLDMMRAGLLTVRVDVLDWGGDDPPPDIVSTTATER